MASQRDPLIPVRALGAETREVRPSQELLPGIPARGEKYWRDQGSISTPSNLPTTPAAAARRGRRQGLREGFLTSACRSGAVGCFQQNWMLA
jgi:hypothetical protein